MKMARSTPYMMLAGLLLLASGCQDATGAGSAANTKGLSLSVVRANTDSSGLNISSTGSEMTLSDSTDTLVLSSVQLVLRRIELAQADTMCSPPADSTESSHDGPMTTDGWHRNRWGEWDRNDCEELKVGPILVDVPLDGQVQKVFSVDIPEGTYNGAEFWIHTPSSTDSTDLAFVADHPDFDSVSVRVEGTFNGNAFTYTHAIRARQHSRLDPPLVVSPDSGATNLTLRVNLDKWFVGWHGTLIDPSTANVGGDNEWLVAWHIMRSFWTFKDRNEDGECDRH